MRVGVVGERKWKEEGENVDEGDISFLLIQQPSLAASSHEN